MARIAKDYLDDEIFCSMWVQGFRPGGSRNLRGYPTYMDKYHSFLGNEASINAYVKNVVGEDSMFGMFGRTEDFREMGNRVKRTFNSKNMSILITGETGTGKEIVAKAIRFYGDRKGKPFARLNVARLNGNSELFASHAFGVKRGAFTGAINQKGAFEEADGGILYLNEIGVLSEYLQSTLLEFFDDYTITPLGEICPKAVDVKVISSTNVDLDALSGKGEFREDLIYRLRGYDIHVPSLDKRRGDIPLLAEVFRRIYSDKYGMGLEITDTDFDRLKSCRWEGNIRELEHFIERSAINGELDWSDADETGSETYNVTDSDDYPVVSSD